MKKLLFSLSFSGVLLLTGCFETTQEITLNEDGTGTLNNTSDMSAMIGLIKQMGGSDATKLGEEAVDTTFSLASQVDSISNLTDEEKELLKKGSVHINMNMKDDKFISTMSFPFSKPDEISALIKLSAKVTQESLKQQLGNNPAFGDAIQDTSQTSSMDDYFTMSFSNGLLVKTINKEKYAGAADDEYLKGMKETAAMGIPMTATYIINLPRPAKKVEGKNVQISEDKKKITVKTDIDDFFDDPAKMEFRIEY